MIVRWTTSWRTMATVLAVGFAAISTARAVPEQVQIWKNQLCTDLAGTISGAAAKNYAWLAGAVERNQDLEVRALNAFLADREKTVLNRPQNLDSVLDELTGEGRAAPVFSDTYRERLRLLGLHAFYLMRIEWAAAVLDQSADRPPVTPEVRAAYAFVTNISYPRHISVLIDRPSSESRDRLFDHQNACLGQSSSVRSVLNDTGGAWGYRNLLAIEARAVLGELVPDIKPTEYDLVDFRWIPVKGATCREVRTFTFQHAVNPDHRIRLDFMMRDAQADFVAIERCDSSR